MSFSDFSSFRRDMLTYVTPVPHDKSEKKLHTNTVRSKTQAIHAYNNISTLKPTYNTCRTCVRKNRCALKYS